MSKNNIKEHLVSGFEITDNLGVNKKVLKKIKDRLNDAKVIKELYKKNLEITKNDIKKSVIPDLFLINAINNIDDLDKVINTLVKRLREWHSLYLPELSEHVEDNRIYSQLIESKNKEELLEEIGVAESESMGGKMTDADINQVKTLSKQINNLYDLRDSHEQYLEFLMQKIAPNVNIVAGSLIGARLLAHAGNLKNLSDMPASTIQLLGAEKALFRHITTGARCPRHGLIMNHPLVASSSQKEHGKRARVLADKISIAARVDYFKGEPIGEELKNTLEKRFGYKER